MAGRAATPQGRKLGNINNMPNRRYLPSINFFVLFARWSHFYVSIDWTKVGMGFIEGFILFILLFRRPARSSRSRILYQWNAASKLRCHIQRHVAKTIYGREKSAPSIHSLRFKRDFDAQLPHKFLYLVAILYPQSF
jgi:hypothetical protein